MVGVFDVEKQIGIACDNRDCPHYDSKEPRGWNCTYEEYSEVEWCYKYRPSRMACYKIRNKSSRLFFDMSYEDNVSGSVFSSKSVAINTANNYGLSKDTYLVVEYFLIENREGLR